MSLDRRVFTSALLAALAAPARGPIMDVLTLDNLAALYRAPVKRLTDPSTGEQAFLPG